jgi:hypothetical protein
MGRRKLHVASSSSRTSVSSSQGQGPAEYQWSTQSYTLGEILNSFKLPIIVQCTTQSCSVLWSNFQFDLGQPLLLYSKRSVKKACARCLRWEEGTEGYTEFGPSVVIPQDYEGKWVLGGWMVWWNAG